MLLPVLPRDERERSLMFESIGPVWDGNEVWLVVAAGATFAAFPAWYATMFSGFYLALLLILVLLIVRVVSFEWREKRDSPRWRSTWLWANTVGSFGAPFLWGVALANLLHGVPLDSSHAFAGDVLDLFSAYTVLAGLAVVAIFAVHGATYLTLRTDRRPPRTRRRDGARACRCPPRSSASRSSPGPSPSPTIATTAGILPTAVPAALTALALSSPRRCSPAHAASGWAFAATGLGRDRLRRDDLHRPVSARARLGPDVRQQPDGLQRRRRALRAPGDHGRRGDLHAARAALPGLDVPRVPQATGRARRSARPTD